MFWSLISILTKQQRLIRVILHQRAKSDETSLLTHSSALRDTLAPWGVYILLSSNIFVWVSEPDQKQEI